jgi:hypothetical protein
VGTKFGQPFEDESEMVDQGNQTQREWKMEDLMGANESSIAERVRTADFGGSEHSSEEYLQRTY